MTAGRVLVIGDVMQDIVVRLDGPIRHATDQRAAIRVLPGGAGANQAAWLAHAGVAVRLLACVGAEDLEAERARLQALGVEPALVGHRELRTGRLIALVDPDGERSFLTDRGANDGLARTALPATLLDGISHVHVSGYALVGPATRDAALGLMADAKAAGLTLSVDPGSAGFVHDLSAARVLTWIRDAAFIAVNLDEAAALTGRSSEQDQLAALNAVVPLVLLKRGAAGAVARRRDGRSWQAAAPPARVVDTIGAGDAFLAGFLAAWLAGTDVAASLQRAVALGAEAVTKAGGGSS